MVKLKCFINHKFSFFLNIKSVFFLESMSVNKSKFISIVFAASTAFDFWNTCMSISFYDVSWANIVNKRPPPPLPGIDKDERLQFLKYLL